MAEPLAKGTVVGRLVVVEPLEHRASELYTAYDPGLDRKVCLRLLPADASEDQASAVTRLTHPNVVTVHDVGVFEGRPYVAMELVDGMPLTLWQAEDRSTDELVAAYAAAAHGLQAVHAEGLVHGDFNPDNVVVGTDGRICVGNFGAAATTAYLAPEQLRGEQPDARSDQFSFCVALYEALVGTRPFDGDARPSSGGLPRRLASVILHGLRSDPTERNPSMAVVAAALEPDGRRITLLALGCGALALGIGIWATMRRPSLDSTAGGYCATVEARAAETWTERRRADLVAALMTDAAVHAAPAVDATAEGIDRYVASWTLAVTSLCKDEAAGDPPPRIAARMACLQGRLVAVDVLVDSLLTTGPRGRSNALGAVDRLPSIAGCSSDREPVGLDNPALPDDVTSGLSELFARSRTQSELSFHEEALQTAQQAVALARSAEDDGLLAEALYYEAYALANLGRTDDAARVAREATRLAIAAEHHWQAFYSLVLEATLIADDRDSTRADELLTLAAAQLQAYGEDDLLEAWLLSARAKVASSRGQVQDALEYYRRAAEKRTALEHPIAAAHDYINVGGLLIASGDTQAGLQSLELAESMLLPLYGPKHQTMIEIRTNVLSAKLWLAPGPETVELARTTLADAMELFGERHEITVFLQGRYAYALTSTDLTEARTQAARSVQLSAAAFGPDHPNALSQRALLVTILTDQGALEEAQQELDEALSVVETPTAHLLVLQARLHRLTENHEQALAASERAVAQGIEEVGPESSNLVAHRELLALSLVSLGRIEDALREHDTMARVLRAAVRRGEWLESEAGLAIARFAEALAEADPDHPRLEAMITEAQTWTDAIDIETSDDAELLAWLRALPPLGGDRLAE